MKGYPSIQTQVRPPVVPARGNVLPEPEIHVRLMELLGLVPEPSVELRELARNADTPSGAREFMSLVKLESSRNAAVELAWTYRPVGPLLPAPGLVAVWQLCFAHAATRREAVVRALGSDWADKDTYELGCELWRRIETQPGGVEIARLDRSTNLRDNIGWEDGRIRLLPAGIVPELRGAVSEESPGRAAEKAREQRTGRALTAARIPGPGGLSPYSHGRGDFSYYPCPDAVAR